MLITTPRNRSFRLITSIALALTSGLAGCGDGEGPATPAGSDLGEASQEVVDMAMVGATYLSATMASAAYTSAATHSVAALIDLPGGGQGTGILDSLLASTCPVITYEGNETGFWMELDYGTGCTPARSEVEVAGLVRVDADALDPGVAFLMSWDGYEYDEVGVDGTVEATLAGNTLSWIIDGTVSDDATSVTGDMSMSATLIANAPGTVEDDEVSVTGSGTIVSDDLSLAFVISSVEPLLLRTGCDYPVAGDVTVTSARGEARIDYGEGECDSMATIWVGQYSWEIDLSNVDLVLLLDS